MRSFLRRLCLLIFALRRFFSEPITDFYFNFDFTPGFFRDYAVNCQMVNRKLINHFVERILDDALGAGSLERRDQFPDDMFVNDRLHCNPAVLCQR